MQKILASDFDGTLFRDGKIHEEDAKAIRYWCRKNRFGLVTGRDPRSVEHALSEAQIPYDFILCRGGALGYFKDGTRFQNRVLITDLPHLQERIHALSACSFQLFGVTSMYSLVWKTCAQGAMLLQTMKPYHEIKKHITEIEIPYAISCECENAQEANRIAKTLQTEFSSIHAVSNLFYVDITAKQAGKEDGLLALLQAWKLPQECLYTIGDGENDRAMLQRFHGFAIQGNPSVEKSAHCVVTSIQEALQQLHHKTDSE